MFPISKILAPVDFSDRSLAVLHYAKAIASGYQAELVLLHLMNPVHTITAAGPFGPVLVPVPQTVFEDAATHLDQFGAGLLADVQVRRLVYEGDPVEQIVAFAHSEDTQLIVMSTHGFGALRRFLLGSVVAKVLHDVACPVLTGVHRQESPEPKPPSFSKVLCALDLGPNSGRILEWASQSAKDFHAKLGVVHVVHSGSPGHEREELDKVVQALGAHADDVYIREGEAAKMICSVAESSGADLLVIGRGSHEGRLRSNAYAVISQSPCPVVSV